MELTTFSLAYVFLGTSQILQICAICLFSITNLFLCLSVCTSVFKGFLIGHTLEMDIDTLTFFSHISDIQGDVHVLKEDILRNCIFNVLPYRKKVKFFKKIVKLI